MRQTILITGLTSVAALAVGALWFGGGLAPDGWSTLETACIECHNDVDLAGNLSFSGLGPDAIAAHPEEFEKVVRKLRGRLMPPPGGPEVATSKADALISQIETRLDRAAEPMAGHVRAQRLTRTEYAHAIEGLLGVSIDPVEYLPTEIEVEGFTNIENS